MPDKTALLDWLSATVDDLPLTGQIILNLDGDTVAWEVKAVHESRDISGNRERTEIRKFGTLRIKGRVQSRVAALAKI